MKDKYGLRLVNSGSGYTHCFSFDVKGLKSSMMLITSNLTIEKNHYCANGGHGYHLFLATCPVCLSSTQKRTNWQSIIF